MINLSNLAEWQFRRVNKITGFLTGPLTCSSAATQRSEHSLYRPCRKSSFTSSRWLRHSSFLYGRKADFVALTCNIFLGDLKDAADAELEIGSMGLLGTLGEGVVLVIGWCMSAGFSAATNFKGIRPIAYQARCK